MESWGCVAFKRNGNCVNVRIGFAGGAQFIMCALLAANSPMSAIILTTFIVNLRNFLLSAALAPHFSKYSLAKNVGIGMMVTDESFGVASNKIVKKSRLTTAGCSV